MRMTHSKRTDHRAGTVLPMIAVGLTSIFAFTALAIDLGLLAVSRTECQNAADAAALVGCRTLNSNSTQVNSNLTAAVAAAKATVQANTDMGANYTASQVAEVDAGQYLYSTTSSPPGFAVYNGSGTASTNLGWTNVTTTAEQSSTPTSGPWTAMQVKVSYAQPMYFLTIFGVNSMPTGATAGAVYRPRDTVFVLDMTGSMGYASQFNLNNKSNNPDTLIPMFGHYYSTYTNSIQNVNQYTSDGQCYSQSNFSIYTPDGPPIIRDYVYDPANVSSPATSAYPITSNSSTLMNAFHRWGGSLSASMSGSNPPESGASTLPPSYKGPVYNFTGYNAFDTTGTYGPTPAPDNFMAQTDVPGIPYVGDRWPRLDGKVWTTLTSTASSSGNPYPQFTYTPAWNDATSGAALNDFTYLGINTGSPPTPPASSTPTTYNTSWSSTGTSYNFRDPMWETYGYDLIMGPVGTATDYRTVRNAAGANNTKGAPISPASLTTLQVTNMTWVQPSPITGGTWPNASANPTGATANRFKGYSMGPGYWGKTFFIWPPDPRFSASATLTAPNQYCPAFDTSGNPMCDWRRHFFLNSSGAAFNAQTTNINSTLFSTGSGQTLSNSTSNYQINYPAVLAWIKSGPQVLPPNLRAGRIIYYSSIPNDVNTSGVTGQVLLDKVFWKQYINYVLGYGYTSSAYLYGQADSWSADPVWINSSSPATMKYSWDSSAIAPYMNYSDSPLRPRLHFWFGPMSMVDFVTGIATGGSANWMPGTCHEAQCWQLKVAMNSVIADVQNNHPNDTLGMVMFSANANNGPRIGQGQSYSALQNALFYPLSLLPTINLGNTTTSITTEESPFTSSWTNALVANEIPNAQGSTDPNTGFAYAYNLLSASNQLASQNQLVGGYGTGARRGASKMVIFETDGVPNTYRGTTGSGGMVLTDLGYDSYYPTSNWSSGQVTSGDPTVESNAQAVVKQIAAAMATSGSGSSTLSSGLSLPNAPAYVYPIAFGDLFDTTLAPGATFRPAALDFLGQVAKNGNTAYTGTTPSSSPPSNQIITGDYNTRINLLQTCFQDIFQAGVTVALVE